MTLEELQEEIQPADQDVVRLSKERWMKVGKPLFSLGKLEQQITRIAGIKRIACYEIKKKALVVMCADNGVVAEGVTQTGQEVTAIVAENFSRHETSACLMAEVAGVDIYPVDIGMITDVKNVTRKNEKTAYGTKNFAKEPAMTREQLWQAIETGIRIAGEKKQEGYDILLTGEMGIGNTTTSSAVASVLLNRDPAVMTGKGAGLDDDGLKRKIHVIEDAIGRYNLRQADVIGIGKIHDIFCGEGITESLHSTSSVNGMEQTIDICKKDFEGLCFVNLVDFDALWGHRRNPEGYGREIEKMDQNLGVLLDAMREDDLLIITADHGNDPTYTGTDHTREYVPLLAYSKKMKAGGKIADTDTFAVIGATIADNFDIRMPEGTVGYSILEELK